VHGHTAESEGSELALLVQAARDRRESFLIAPGWLMGAWNKDGDKGYWHVDRPHAVMAHMCGMAGKHQHGKKLGFKVGSCIAAGRTAAALLDS
jgi:hypothetical protein